MTDAITFDPRNLLPAKAYLLTDAKIGEKATYDDDYYYADVVANGSIFVGTPAGLAAAKDEANDTDFIYEVTFNQLVFNPDLADHLKPTATATIVENDDAYVDDGFYMFENGGGEWCHACGDYH